MVQAAAAPHMVLAAAAPRMVQPDAADLSLDHACSIVVELESPQ